MALDLLGGRALEAAGLALAGVGGLHAERDGAGAGLHADHPHRHAREGLAPARAFWIRAPALAGPWAMAAGTAQDQEQRGEDGDARADHGWASRAVAGHRRRASDAAAKMSSATSTTAPPAASRR